jgi:hypothetical protein
MSRAISAARRICVIGTLRNHQLYIDIRPHCPKCKKEFMLDLKRFLPGRAHSCHDCGTVTQFDSQMAEQMQKLLRDLEVSIHAIYAKISSEKVD